jgi:hypothetical protein
VLLFCRAGNHPGKLRSTFFGANSPGVPRGFFWWDSDGWPRIVSRGKIFPSPDCSLGRPRK